MLFMMYKKIVCVNLEKIFGSIVFINLAMAIIIQTIEIFMRSLINVQKVLYHNARSLKKAGGRS